MSRVPYVVVSDTHNHGWQQFATQNTDGVNSRLQILLDEQIRASDTAAAAGGTVLFHAGDLFHVRGKIAPSVLTPVKDSYRFLVEQGRKVILLAGNHDLEGKDSNRLGSAITALEDVGCVVINRPSIIELSPTHKVCMVPWHEKLNELKAAIEKIRDDAKAPGVHIDLIIHAPVDGVIPGLPDHGLDNTWLAGLGFDLVLSGHYHNHKDFGNGVASIGAIAHHTWGDVNSKAGFLLVDDAGKIRYMASRAPGFIEVDSSTDPNDIPLMVPGNYVRVKINSSKTSDIAAVRDLMTTNGAKGVVVLSQKAPTVAPRTGSTVKAGQTLEGSVGAFVDAGEFKNKPELTALCMDILSTVKAAATSATAV